MFFCVSGFGVATFPDVHRHFITEVYFDIMKAVLLQQQQQQQQKKLNKKRHKRHNEEYISRDEKQGRTRLNAPRQTGLKPVCYISASQPFKVTTPLRIVRFFLTTE